MCVRISFHRYCEALPLTRQVLSEHLQYQQGCRAPAGRRHGAHSSWATKTTLSRQALSLPMTRKMTLGPSEASSHPHLAGLEQRALLQI